MWNWIHKAHELEQAGSLFALVTITECSGSSPRGPGTKMIVLPTGEFFGTVGGGQLEELVIKDALHCLERASSHKQKYPLCMKMGQCCGGSVETLVEIVGLGPKLYVFGAGHVGQSLAQTLEGTPFALHMVDERSEWIHHPSLPSSVRRHQVPWKQFVNQAQWNSSETYAAVMTHDHQLDLEIIEALATKPAKYIGLIGSQTKWQRFTQRLRGKDLDEDAIARIHCPIGLKIGGKAPREVAVSIAAELLKVHHD